MRWEVIPVIPFNLMLCNLMQSVVVNKYGGGRNVGGK